MAKRVSGASKTYKQRVKDGLRPVFVWLPPEAAAALDDACATSGASMTEVIVELLLSSVGVKRRRAEAVPVAQRDAPNGHERRTAVVVATGEIVKGRRAPG